MKFERLRVTGFKSFCDAAEFKIEPGLTGVVGPNGCGKSNLVEALRWVMGESSFKAMRGSGMDDVIFSGSGKRPSRNNAEVGICARQFRPPRAGRLQRARDDRGHAPHRARGGLDLSRQRPGGARPRRAASVRRRLDRRPLARPRPPGPDRRDHRRQAAGAAADPRRGGRHFRPAFAPPRGGAAPQGGGGQSSARRGRAEADRRPGREPQAPGAPVEPLPQSRRRHPPPRGARPPDRLAGGRDRLRRGGEEARRRPPRRRRAHPRPGRGGAPAGAGRRRAAGLARRGGAPRRRAPAHRHRPRDPRGGGEARGGAQAELERRAGPVCSATSSARRR